MQQKKPQSEAAACCFHSPENECTRLQGTLWERAHKLEVYIVKLKQWRQQYCQCWPRTEILRLGDNYNQAFKCFLLEGLKIHPNTADRQNLNSSKYTPPGIAEKKNSSE